MDLLQLLQEYGPLGGAVIFFLWRDFRREDRLANRIDKLEDEQRDVILPLVQNSTAVIARNTEVMERLEDALKIPRVKSDADEPKS